MNKQAIDSLPRRIKPEPEGVSPLSRPGESNVKPEPLGMDHCDRRFSP